MLHPPPEQVFCPVLFTKNRQKAGALRFLYPNSRLGGADLGLATEQPPEVAASSPELPCKAERLYLRLGGSGTRQQKIRKAEERVHSLCARGILVTGDLTMPTPVLNIYVNIFGFPERNFWFWDTELDRALFDGPMFEPSEEREFLSHPAAAMNEAIEAVLGTAWEYAANQPKIPLSAMRVLILDPPMLESAKAAMSASPYREKLKQLGVALYLNVAPAVSAQIAELKQRQEAWFD